MRKKAFTFIELVIVLTIVGIFSGAFSWFLIKVMDVWKFTSFRSEIVNEARISFIQMTRQIRQIKKDLPSAIEDAGSDRLQFVRLDSGGNDVRLRYRYAPLTEELFYEIDSNDDGSFDVSDTSEILVSRAAPFTFRYYDSLGGQIVSDPLSADEREGVCYIEVQFDVNEGDQSYTLKTRVFPRNLK